MSKPFLVSFPKSGTHLMRHILGMKRENSEVIDKEFELFTWRYREYDNGCSGHLVYWPGYMEMLGDYVTMFLIRDPRDIIVSWKHYQEIEDSKHWNIFDFRGEELDINDYQDKIMFLMRVLYQRFVLLSGWLQDSIVLRYERLLLNPEEELLPVAEALDRDLDELVERSKFRGGPTFRKGLIGEWKKEFTEDHINYFNIKYERIMEMWNYE